MSSAGPCLVPGEEAQVRKGLMEAEVEEKEDGSRLADCPGDLGSDRASALSGAESVSADDDDRASEATSGVIAAAP